MLPVWSLWFEGRLFEASSQFIFSYLDNEEEYCSFRPYFSFFHSLFFSPPQGALIACHYLKKVIVNTQRVSFLKKKSLDSLEREELMILMILDSSCSIDHVPFSWQNVSLEDLRTLYSGSTQICEDQEGLPFYVKKQQSWLQNKQSFDHQHRSLIKKVMIKERSCLPWLERKKCSRIHLHPDLLNIVWLDDYRKLVWDICDEATHVVMVFTSLAQCYHYLLDPEILHLLSLKHHALLFLNEDLIELLNAQKNNVDWTLGYHSCFEGESDYVTIDQMFCRLITEFVNGTEFSYEFPFTDLFEACCERKDRVDGMFLPRHSFWMFSLLQHRQYWWNRLCGHNHEYPLRYSPFLKELTILQHNIAIQVPLSHKPRVVHVVPRLIDHGFAPSQRLEVILKAYSSQEWDIHLLIIDQYRLRPQEYPYCLCDDESSLVRGKERIARFMSLGITIDCLNEEEDLRSQLEKRVDNYHKEQPLCVIFHDPNEAMYWLASSLKIERRVFFEHGALPYYPCFDVIFLNHSYEAHRWNCTSKVPAFSLEFPLMLPTCSRYPLRQSLSLGPKTVLLTTISNILGARLTPMFCQTLVAILKNAPQAVYLPIGFIEEGDVSRLMSYFRKYGVADQVFFLGQLHDPMAYLQDMDLYLNDFPVGGGLANLEALCCDVVVISLFEEDSTLRSRQGALYINCHESCTATTPEEYCEKALMMIRDEEKRLCVIQDLKKIVRNRGSEIEYQKQYLSLLKQVTYECFC